MLTLFFIIVKCCAVLKMSWWWIILMIFIDHLYLFTAKEYYYEKWINEEAKTILKKAHEEASKSELEEEVIKYKSE